MLVNTKTLSLAHLKTCKNMFSDTQNNFCTCYLLILLVSRVLEERFSVNQHLRVNQKYAPNANICIHFCIKILQELAKNMEKQFLSKFGVPKAGLNIQQVRNYLFDLNYSCFDFTHLLF